MFQAVNKFEKFFVLVFLFVIFVKINKRRIYVF